MKTCRRCIFKHFVVKIAQFIPEWLGNKINSIKKMMWKSIDARYLKIVTSYLKSMAASVSLTAGTKFVIFRMYYFYKLINILTNSYVLEFY